MWLTVVVAILRWLILCFSIWREQSAARKAIKKDARKMLGEYIKTRDPQKAISAYDKLRRAKWIVLLMILFLNGCGRGIWLRSPITTDPPIVIHPITPDNWFFVPKGAVVEWDDTKLSDIGIKPKDAKKLCIDVTPDGILLGDRIRVQNNSSVISDFVLEEIMEAKVGE